MDPDDFEFSVVPPPIGLKDVGGALLFLLAIVFGAFAVLVMFLPFSGFYERHDAEDDDLGCR